jgi:serine/threonine protein kinase
MEDHGNYAGKTVGNYRIIALIGSGGFGSVYQGEHVYLNERIVAIKILHTHLSSQEQRSHFLEEARLLGHLQHPYILQIFDTGIDVGLPYLVTEYAPHGSLRDLLNRQQDTILPEDISLTILSQVGEALAYAHQHHIIHRDLKPENILFNATDEALLADFGIATTLYTSSVKYSTVMGTPAYMAPEQFQGTLSQQGDQYALGCIAYELFTGHKPFEAPDFIAMGFKHLMDIPIPPHQLNPSVPMHIEQAILTAMAKQRQDRYPDVKTFLAALQGETLSRRSVHPQSVPGFGTTQTSNPEGNLPTLPAAHLSQEETFVRATTSGYMQLSGYQSAQRPAMPVENNDERPKGVTGGIFPTQYALPPDERGWHGAPSFQPYQSQPQKSGRRRLILMCACALIALAVIAPLLFVSLSTYVHAHNSATTGSVTVTTMPTPSPTSVASHKKAVTGQPTQVVTTSGSTQLPSSTSVPTSGPTAVAPTHVAPTPTPTMSSNPTPTPTPTTKPNTAETFRVYFKSANTSGVEVSTQNTYSGTVSIIVSGFGIASTPNEYSDAFYIYTDTSGNPITPHTATCWVMYINGSTADASVGLPSYDSSHTYSVTMSLSQLGTINFGICDGDPTDNTGYLTVTVQQQ